MGGNKGNKQSKNNPDLKIKKKENKIYDSQHCLKCPNHEDCKEYNDYVLRMKIKGVGYGITCKHGK
jgi:hypothetical protein